MNPLGLDTAERCWLCDRDGGQLCHVHERVEPEDEPELVWTRLGGDVAVRDLDTK